eukprot:1739249-Rhodomonas_salina.4
MQNVLLPSYPTVLRARYTMSGTDVHRGDVCWYHSAYRPTPSPVLTSAPRATRCPVLKRLCAYQAAESEAKKTAEVRVNQVLATLSPYAVPAISLRRPAISLRRPRSLPTPSRLSPYAIPAIALRAC